MTKTPNRLTRLAPGRHIPGDAPYTQRPEIVLSRGFLEHRVEVETFELPAEGFTVPETVNGLWYGWR